MKNAWNIIFVSMIMILPFPAVMGEEEKSPDALPLDSKFFVEFLKTPPVLRDNFLESKINTLVQGRGVVASIKKVDRFKKMYRIVLADRDAEALNVRFIYHIYIDSRNSIALLKEQERLEFCGQLVAGTPLNSRRDAYILDIIFEKGAILVE